MSNCNALHTTAYVLLLERLRKEGYFENFTEEDYENLVESSISYMDRFKSNLEKFETLKAKNPTKRGVNVVSKHHFSFMDFTENIGVRPLPLRDSDALVTTKYDVIADAEDIFFPLEKDDKGKISIRMDLKKLGVRLNYDTENELFYMSGDMQSVTSDVAHDLNLSFFSSVRGKENKIYTFASETLMPSLNSFLTSVANSNIVSSDTLTRTFAGYDMDVISSSFAKTPVGRGTDVERMVVIRNSPLTINNDELKGAFVSKDKLSFAFAESLKTLILNYVERQFNMVGGAEKDTPLPEALISEFTTSVSPLLDDLAKKTIEDIQERRDNGVIEAFNELQKGSIIHTVSYLGREFGKENNDLLERYNRSKDGLLFTIDAVAINKEISTIPMYDKKMIQYTKVDFSKEELADSLDRIKHAPITPKSVKFHIGLKKKTSSLEVVDFQEGETLELAMRRNDTMNRYLIDKSFAESNFFDVTILDEADKRAGGKFAMVFRSVVERAISIVAALGTLTAGMAKDVVPPLALSGKMGSVGVENNIIEFTKQCGVSEIKSKLLVAVAFGVNNDSFLMDFSKMYDSYVNAKTKKDGKSENTYSILLEGVKNILIPSLIANNISQESDFDNTEYNKEVTVFKTLFNGMMKINNDTMGALELGTLTEQAVSKSHSLTKQVPGNNNPKTFVGLIQSAGNQNTSIMSRETLSGKKETLIIEDIKAQKVNFPKTDKDGSPYNEEVFLKNNRAGIRLAQAAIKEYASDRFLYGIVEFLTQNFSNFIENFVDSRGSKGQPLRDLVDYLNKKHDNTFTSGSLFTIFEKSSSSGTDDFGSIYKNYILLNGNLDSEKSYRNMDELKKSVFFDMIKLFDSFIKEGVFQIAASGEYNLLLGENESTNLNFSNYYLIDSFQSTRGELTIKDLLDDLVDAYPQSYIFSSKVEICPPEYKYLFEKAGDDGYYMPYRVNFTNNQENEVFDGVASTGIEGQIDEVVQEDSTAVISAARTTGVMLNFMATLDSAIRSRQENSSSREVALILNVPASSKDEGLSFRNISNRLNNKIIEQAGVTIHPIPRSVLDSTVKSNIEKGFQTLVVTNYISASRGLDLSGLAKIVATGAMTQGKEMIQFLSRTFSVNRQEATISMFHGGCDAQLSAADKDGKANLVDFVFPKITNVSSPAEHEKILEKTLKTFFDTPSRGAEGITAGKELLRSCPATLSFSETQTGKVSSMAIDKLMVFKAFISGKKTSIDSVVGLDKEEASPVFTPSKSYETKINNLVTDIENGIYDKNIVPKSKNKSEQKQEKDMKSQKSKVKVKSQKV